MPNLFENMSSDEISQLLVDCSANRLPETKVKEIEAFVEPLPALAEELAFYKGLVAAGNPAASVSSPGELGWARLSQALDADEKAGDIGQLPVAANDNISRVWRFAACAFAFLFVAQTAFQFLPQADSAGNGEQYLPVTQAAQLNTLQVAFSPIAQEQDIRALLGEVNGQIVSGPSALGLYNVQFADKSALVSGQDGLLQASDVVETVTAINQ